MALQMLFHLYCYPALLHFFSKTESLNILDRNFVFSSASLHQFLLALLAFLFYGLFQVLDVHIPKKLLA